jgi:hypothetical protein
MSKKGQGRPKPAPAGKRKRRSAESRSPVIPIAVGVVVVTIVLAAIISAVGRGPAGADNTMGPVATVQAQATQVLPYSSVPRISLEETLQMLEQGEAVLVDVRSRSSYDEAHAAGARSVPEEEMDARANELPRDQDLVLY